MKTLLSQIGDTVENLLLKNSRERLQLTCEQVCSQTGMLPEEYHAIENGTRLPEHEETILIAELLGIPFEYVYHSCLQTGLLYTHLRCIAAEKQLNSLRRSNRRKQKHLPPSNLPNNE